MRPSLFVLLRSSYRFLRFRARVRGERAGYEPILALIMRSHLRNCGSNGARTRTAIVDQGNPGAWNGTLITARATTVACVNDAKVLDGLLGALDPHRSVFGLLMGLADALGSA